MNLVTHGIFRYIKMDKISIRPEDAIWVDEDWTAHRIIEMPIEKIYKCLEAEHQNEIWREVLCAILNTRRCGRDSRTGNQGIVFNGVRS